MSKETYPTITRRNVLAGIGATGAGLALGAHGAAAGEKEMKSKKNKVYLPVAYGWQEAFDGDDIDAFPDDDDDSTVDFHDDNGDDIDDLCDLFDEIDDPRSSELRTSNSLDEPIVHLPSVTQGDGGETTLYFQSCDEDVPAQVWLKTPTVHVDKKLQHNAKARVWYDVLDEDDGDDDADFGDNVYQEEEPIIAQGSLKHVLKKLKGGVHLDADPHVAVNDNGTSYEEGINYYAYPHELVDVDSLDHEPRWITDDNVKEYVKKPKVHAIQNLSAGAKLFIPGEGYVGGDEDNPLPDLEVTLTEIIRNERGKVAGFRWSSNLPLCRIELDTGNGTHVNTFNGATDGEAMAVDDEDTLVPITGIQFGVCGEEELECFEPGEVGAIGFEWWIPDGTKLGEKTKMKVDFDFKAKPCPEVPPDVECDEETTLDGLEIELDCEEDDGTFEGTFDVTVDEERGQARVIRAYEPGTMRGGEDETVPASAEAGDEFEFEESSDSGFFYVEVSRQGESVIDLICCDQVQ